MNVLIAADASVARNRGIGIVEKVVIRVGIRSTKGFYEESLGIVRRAARESEQIRMGL